MSFYSFICFIMHETQSYFHNVEWLKSLQNITYLLSLNTGSNLVPLVKSLILELFRDLCIFLRSSFKRIQIRDFRQWIKWRWYGRHVAYSFSVSIKCCIFCRCFPQSHFAFHYELLIIPIYYIFVSSFDISLLSFATFVFVFMLTHQLCSLDDQSVW